MNPPDITARAILRNAERGIGDYSDDFENDLKVLPEDYHLLRELKVIAASLKANHAAMEALIRRLDQT